MTKLILSLVLALTINAAQSQCNANFNYTVNPMNQLHVSFSSAATFPAGSFAMLPKWYINGSLVDSINKNPTLIFKAGGTYSVTFWFKICIGAGIFCMDDTTKIITVGDLSTGISENSLDNGFSVYPNPSNSGFITIKNTGLNNVYTISNINGQVVKRGKLDGVTETINTGDLESGMYFVACGTKTIKVVLN